jgi:hypothetical protein
MNQHERILEQVGIGLEDESVGTHHAARGSALIGLPSSWHTAPMWCVSPSRTPRFKPGVEALYMVFSDQSTEHVYRFPYYDYFKSAIEPLLEQVRLESLDRRVPSGSAASTGGRTDRWGAADSSAPRADCVPGG